MSEESDRTDWNLTTWEGSCREQIRRWSKLTMDEILAAQEEMAELADSSTLATRQTSEKTRLPTSDL